MFSTAIRSCLRLSLTRVPLLSRPVSQLVCRKSPVLLAIASRKFSSTPDSVVEQPRRTSRPATSPTLFVGNLGFSTDAAELREQFEVFGEIQDIRIAVKPDGQSRGFAHVSFAKQDDAVAAYNSAAQEPIHLNGRDLRIDYALSKFTATPDKKLYFSSFKGDEHDLRDCLKEFESSLVTISPFRTAGGEPSGSGYIEMMDINAATEVLQKLNGQTSKNGSVLRLQYALNRTRDSSSPPKRKSYGGDWGGGHRSSEFNNRRGDTDRAYRKKFE